jgi:hypothetical protein
MLFGRRFLILIKTISTFQILMERTLELSNSYTQRDIFGKKDLQ